MSETSQGKVGWRVIGWDMPISRYDRDGNDFTIKVHESEDGDAKPAGSKTSIEI